MLSGCWLHIKQPLSGTWGCREEGDSGYVVGLSLEELQPQSQECRGDICKS